MLIRILRRNAVTRLLGIVAVSAVVLLHVMLFLRTHVDTKHKGHAIAHKCKIRTDLLENNNNLPKWLQSDADEHTRQEKGLSVLMLHKSAQPVAEFGSDQRLMRQISTFREQCPQCTFTYVGAHALSQEQLDSHPGKKWCESILGGTSSSSTSQQRCFSFSHDSEQFVRFLGERHFDLVIAVVYFWEPQSVADTHVPVILNYYSSVKQALSRALNVLQQTQPDSYQCLQKLIKRPIVAAQSDDAHYKRAVLLSRYDADENERAIFAEDSRNIRAAETQFYRYIDLALFLHAEDRDATMSVYGSDMLQVLPSSDTQQQLLPMSQLRAGERSPGQPAYAALMHLGFKQLRQEFHVTSFEQRTPFEQTKDIAFVGNFPNPTNYISLHYFIKYCWPKVREQLGGNVNLLLIGTEVGKGDQCVSRKKYCSPTWGTPLDKRKQEDYGIVELGRITDIDTVLRTVRVFVSPIVASTGLNTKSIEAFRLGIPTVMSNVAARGYMMPEHDPPVSVVKIGAPSLTMSHEDVERDLVPFFEEFTQQIVSLYTQKQQWEQMSKSMIRFMQNVLLQDNALEDDVNQLKELVHQTIQSTTSVIQPQLRA